MFDDLPPLAADAEASKTSRFEEESSCTSLPRDSKRDSTGCALSGGGVGYSAVLAFKPRGVATSIVGSSAPIKTRRKEPVDNIANSNAEPHVLEPPLASSIQTVLFFTEDRIRMIEVPAGLLLEPSVYAESFEAKEPYDPATPTDYGQILSNGIDDACLRNLERLNAEEEEHAALRRQKGASQCDIGQSTSTHNELRSINALVRMSRRNVCNLPSWLTEPRAATGVVPVDDTDLQPPVRHTRATENSEINVHTSALQSLDYSNLSNTLSIVGINNSTHKLLSHLATQIGADAFHSEILRKEYGCEIRLVFKEQANCIRTYHSLAQGDARALCLEADDNPDVKFVII